MVQFERQERTRASPVSGSSGEATQAAPSCLQSRRRSLPRILLAPSILHASLLLATQGPAQHLEAVRLAREGDYDQAVLILESLVEADPENHPLRSDLILVMDWSGRWDDALSQGGLMSPEDVTVPGLMALARSARALGRFEEALRFWECAIERDPADPTPRIGRASTLLQAGWAGKGWDECADSLGAPGPGPERLSASSRIDRVEVCGWLAIESERAFDALKLLQEAGPLAAETRLLRLRVETLRRLGAVALASRETAGHSIEPSLARRVQADLAARHVIWGQIGTEDPARRHDETDLALAALEELLLTEPLSLTLERQVFHDRLLALRNRERFSDVVAAWRDCGEDPEDTPSYALVAVADSLLATKEPELASELYVVVERRGEASFSTRVAHYYARLEGEELDEAAAILDELDGVTTAWRRRGIDFSPILHV